MHFCQNSLPVLFYIVIFITWEVDGRYRYVLAHKQVFGSQSYYVLRVLVRLSKALHFPSIIIRAAISRTYSYVRLEKKPKDYIAIASFFLPSLVHIRVRTS